jgi:hypothetical protein
MKDALWGLGMIRSRSAILMLITCALLSGHSRGSQVSDVSAKPIHAGLSSSTSPSMGWLASFRLSRRATTLSQFVPWKNRVKSVIEGRVHEGVDECDLGPAVVPARRNTTARFVTVDPPILMLPPLRC